VCVIITPLCIVKLIIELTPMTNVCIAYKSFEPNLHNVPIPMEETRRQNHAIIDMTNDSITSSRPHITGDYICKWVG